MVSCGSSRPEYSLVLSCGVFYKRSDSTSQDTGEETYTKGDQKVLTREKTFSGIAQRETFSDGSRGERHGGVGGRGRRKMKRVGTPPVEINSSLLLMLIDENMR